MNTAFLVLAEFEAAEIPLEKVCEQYFGLTLKTAERKANSHNLPVPFYKKHGQKSKFYCRSIDWAEYIDRQAEQAKSEWKRVNER